MWMCDRHGELLAAYQKAVALFSTTLDALQASRATASKDEYDRMRNYVEQTRLISEDARMDLERHVAEHGCGSIGTAVG
jgi:RNase P subunit RPR2